MLIGISGKMQAGKNTLATIIKAYRVYQLENKGNINYKDLKDFILYNIKYKSKRRKNLYKCDYSEHMFGWGIKKMASILLCVPIKKFEDNNFKNSKCFIKNEKGNYYTVREFLQKLGTEMGRSINNNIWVDVLFRRILLDRSIITDVRFINEADAIKSKSGILIRVERDLYHNNHFSETALDNYKDFDYTINNISSIEEFVDKAIIILNKLNL